MSTKSRLHVERKQGSVESWEYDEVTEVSSDSTSVAARSGQQSPLEGSFCQPEHSKSIVYSEVALTPQTRGTPARLTATAPVEKEAEHEGSLMEQAAANSPEVLKDQEGNDSVMMIQPLENQPRSSGLAVISPNLGASDVLGRNFDDGEDDEDEIAEDGESPFPMNDTSGQNSDMLQVMPPSRMSSANLAPPPHLASHSMGGFATSPSPEMTGNNVPNSIDENSEEEEEEENAAIVSEVVENDDDADDDDEAGNVAGISGEGLGVENMAPSGPGSQRLETLELGNSSGAGAGQEEQAGQDDDDEDDDDDDDVQGNVPEGAYDPAEYENLNVSPEIRELFSYITCYTPQAIELEHRLRPYIPDYIPAVGDIDAFIKILPPDNSETKVGLTELDEPSARQSDATVLDLQLRSLAKYTTTKTVSVKTVTSADKNPKVIEKWVRDISDLHRARPPPTVHYSKRMPDIDSLMQEWPGELEELFHELRLPNATLDLDLDNYAGLVCAILDIPVYKSKIQSLHVLFTLYSEFRNSVHFRRLAEDNYMDNDLVSGDRLVIE